MLLRRLLFCLLLPLTLCLPAAGRTWAQLPPDLEAERGRMSGPLSVRPGLLELPGGRTLQDRQPIARALELAAPGALILVGAGRYPRLGIGFSGNAWWNARTSGGTEITPIRVVGESGVRLVCDEPGDTLAVNQQIENGWIQFESIEFEAGERAGIIFYQGPADKPHRGYHFYDCTIDGLWEHATDSGPHSSKWGVLGHNLADFVFAGRRGAIVIRDCNVSDVGLAVGDGYKGGSAFTFAGRLAENTIRVERCTYRAGFDVHLRRLTSPGQPYGTGALVAWDGSEKLANGSLTLSGNRFEFAPGCGDRPVVSIGACGQVLIEGGNQFLAGGDYPALVLDPLTATGELQNLPNGPVRIAAGNSFQGRVEKRGLPIDPSSLAGG